MTESRVLKRLNPEDPRPPFDCDDNDLNEFFTKDSIVSGKELLSVTYILEQNNKALAFFSVSNDSIRKEDVPSLQFKKLVKSIPHEKRYSSLPAVKVGRFATCRGLQKQGIGTALLDFIKVWFTDGNKTGCRFIIVDAYNKLETITFYQKNGFQFLVEEDSSDETRLMFFDLITFKK